jgi:hypothetical protein
LPRDPDDDCSDPSGHHIQGTTSLGLLGLRRAGRRGWTPFLADQTSARGVGHGRCEPFARHAPFLRIEKSLGSACDEHQEIRNIETDIVSTQITHGAPG